MPSNGPEIPSERWARLDALFHAALDVEPDQRSALLDRECADDSDLRQRVEKLLASVGKADDLIDQALEDAVAPSSQEAQARSGQLIGVYRVSDELGQGGMGAVYLAHRDDDQYRKRVALKVIRTGLATEQARQRFRTERQILANMEHPNIARLLDGGTTEEGTPYLVMEYVDGEPINRYCANQCLSLRERLGLFLQVCAAAQHAHSQLVVHRDLKPANILVTSDGIPKLLDFGIAKLLDSEVFDQSLALTRADQRILTPEYAAPEQIRGEPITAATDVYALGVLLYELLTGQRPFREEATAPGSLSQDILTTLPSRPSSVTVADSSTPDWRRQLKGDLDTIVLMALRKEPSRRYASVERLAEDLRRYLDGRPVSARPDTFTYRSGKFIARNRPVLATLALAVVAVVGMLAYHTIQLRAERDVARHEAEKSAQVVRLMSDVFAAADPSVSQGQDISAKDLLHQGAERVDRQLGGQPELQAELRTIIGSAYGSLRLLEEADSLLRSALAQRREQWPEGHATVVANLRALAQVRSWAGDYQEARSLLTEGVTMGEHLLHPGDPLLARSVSALASAHEMLGDYSKAEQSFLRAVALAQRWVTPQPEKLAPILNAYAVMLKNRGRVDEAQTYYQQALSHAHQAFGDAPHPMTAEILNNLGTLHLAQGDHESAGKRLTEVIELRRQLFGADHPETAKAMANLGITYQERGELAKAEASFTTALEIFRTTWGEQHFAVIYTRDNLAHTWMKQDRFAEAEAIYRDVLEFFRTQFGDQHNEVATSLGNLGGAITRRGRIDEARALYQQAEAIFVHNDGADSANVINTRNRLLGLFLHEQRYTEAISTGRENLVAARRVLPSDHIYLATLLMGIGEALRRAGQAEQAEPLLSECLTIRRSIMQPDALDIGLAEIELGAVMLALGRLDEADQLLHHAAEVMTAQPGEQSGHVVEIERLLAQLKDLRRNASRRPG